MVCSEKGMKSLELCLLFLAVLWLANIADEATRVRKLYEVGCQIKNGG